MTAEPLTENEVAALLCGGGLHYIRVQVCGSNAWRAMEERVASVTACVRDGDAGALTAAAAVIAKMAALSSGSPRGPGDTAAFVDLCTALRGVTSNPQVARIVAETLGTDSAAALCVFTLMYVALELRGADATQFARLDPLGARLGAALDAGFNNVAAVAAPTARLLEWARGCPRDPCEFVRICDAIGGALP